ncbi:uncharacterized protein LOC124419190 [Lucilia cuprina]|uniref:uncharacterized protein LOC124419190 n=1 Tax=Lucilia cuprina TaxID=7375 RepID=UPI001F06EEC7|nr:uncharacterized protein LOC124419190 [Lucilia cuprina]
MGSQICTRFIHESENLMGVCNKFSSLGCDDLTESLLEAKLQTLEEDWQSLRRAYEGVYMADDGIVSPDYKANAKSTYEECRDRYQETKAEMIDFIKMSKASAENNQRDSGPSHSSAFDPSSYHPLNMTYEAPDMGVNVPPCDAPDFHGSYEEWPSFRDMFSAVYISKIRMPDVQKLLYLRRKAKGEASSIVNKYPLTNESFSLAWGALRARYENKRVLVDIQLNPLFNIPPAKTESAEAINKIQTTITDCLAMLSSHGVQVENWDPILVYLCSTKLPSETLALWEQSLTTNSILPSWSQMEQFLIKRHRVVERVVGILNEGNQMNYNSNNSNRQKNNKALRVPHCKLCDKNHYLRFCQKFSNFSKQQRNDFVTQNQICINCLSPVHKVSECTSVNRCDQCGNKHHSMLHLNKNDNLNSQKKITKKNSSVNAFHADPIDIENEDTEESTDLSGNPCCYKSTTDATNTQAHLTVNQDDILLPTALVQILHCGEPFTVRALIDSGSKRSFLTSRISKRLNLITENANFEICGLGGTVVANANKVSSITLYNQRHEFKLTTKVIIVSNLTNFMPSCSIEISDLSDIRDLCLADPNFLISAQIDMLLGSDIIPHIILDGLKKNVLGNLIAQNSIYGWYIYGPMKLHTISLTAIDNLQSENESVSSILRKFWEIEEIPQIANQSEADLFCENLYKETTSRQSDGRYVVKLPFKSEFPESEFLQASRYLAKKQYLQIEQRLEKHDTLMQVYNDILNEYISLGHMRKSNSQEICHNGKFFSYYLPHHAVFRPESASTKVRIVFNGSRKTKSSRSLNDVLHVGPTLQADLMTIILNWRLYKYVFNGDIEKMYRQILVHESDRSYQKILFRKNISSPIEDFELTTVTFGIACAPYLAIRTLLQLASDSEKDSPLSARILRKETYVDDILSGGHSLSSAMEAQKQLIDTLKSAGFPLKKITANHPDLLSQISSDDLLNTEFLKLYDSSSTKTLGIRWNAISDSFTYKVEQLNSTSSATKRQILSAVAKLFDPAGWLTPIIIQAKILLQELWQDGVGWDDEVKPQFLDKWKIFVDSFPTIESIEIPRWIHYHPQYNIQIHGFCDASEQAYRATLYVVSENSGIRYSNLLSAKSKVAPLF